MKTDKKLIRLCGIYTIINTIDGKMYVGKSVDMNRRCSQYLYDLKNQRAGHINDYLYRAIQKYGLNNFIFSALEVCNFEKLTERELFWMLELKTTDRNFGYNLRMDSSSGMLVAPETKIKISGNLKRQWAEGVRDKHADKLRSNWKGNAERKEQQSKVMTAALTKYKYEILTPSGETIFCNFKELKKMGLEHSQANMHKTGKNRTKCRKHIVTRHSLKETNGNQI